MQVKRRLSRGDSDEESERYFPRRPRIAHPNDSRTIQQEREAAAVAKRARTSYTDAIAARPPSKDVLSGMPAELLVRIFSYFSEATLLDIALVSRLFRRVTGDGQLWRKHYYRRFILPRADRIPGFRKAMAAAKEASSLSSQAPSSDGTRGGRIASRDDPKQHPGFDVDWKKYYKLQHNWLRGRCEVDEIHFRHRAEHLAAGKTLVKVVDGLAVTADAARGLVVWDLRTRNTVAHASLDSYRGLPIQPTCVAVDDRHGHGQDLGHLGIAVGFEDGTFGIWRLDLHDNTLTKLCRYYKSCFGELAAIAYHHPYLIVGATGGFITLWTFDRPNPQWTAASPSSSCPTASDGDDAAKVTMSSGLLPAPYMLRSLKSHSTRLPLTLSIRRMASLIVASIVYTLDTVSGWCIAIQDLDIRPRGELLPEITDSRVAYTAPSGIRSSPSSSPGSSPSRGGGRGWQLGGGGGGPARDQPDANDGPIRLCYSHPYLLATLPDNTLMLQLCTSTSTSLSISPSIRLWGHTSGISDAEITTRGKAVSVSARGDEIRVWELEGRVGGSSVEVRPRQQDSPWGPAVGGGGESSSMGAAGLFSGPAALELESRKNQVGFDDEMVIVLKEDKQGKESLMVYDFT
jgi:hypothetical protein